MANQTDWGSTQKSLFLGMEQFESSKSVIYLHKNSDLNSKTNIMKVNGC